MEKLLRSLLDLQSTSLRSPHLITWESKAASQSKQTAIGDSFDYELVQGDVQRVYGKIVKHEKDVGVMSWTRRTLCRTRSGRRSSLSFSKDMPRSQTKAGDFHLPI